MKTHVRIVAILLIVFGALGVIASLGMLAAFGVITQLIEANLPITDDDAQFAIPIMRLIGGAIVIITFLISLPAVIAGAGLLQYQEWARILAIIIAGLNLLNIPFGTAFGIYGLWVLLADATQPLFRQYEHAG